MGTKGKTVIPGAIKNMGGRSTAKSGPIKKIKSPMRKYKR